jgi:hypothetical protein
MQITTQEFIGGPVHNLTYDHQQYSEGATLESSINYPLKCFMEYRSRNDKRISDRILCNLMGMVSLLNSFRIFHVLSLSNLCNQHKLLAPGSYHRFSTEISINEGQFLQVDVMQERMYMHLGVCNILL